MVLAALCCLVTGMMAFLTSHMPGDPRSAGAFQTSRVMAVFGGLRMWEDARKMVSVPTLTVVPPPVETANSA